MTNPKPCWECVKRRLVCDFGRPRCRKCQARNVQCSGYDDKKPLTWLAPGQTRSKGRRARTESNVIRLTLRDSDEATTVFEAIEYFNVRICPDMIATGRGGDPKGPLFVPIESTPHLPANIRHTLVSIALSHRILQFEDGFESDRAALSTKLQAHRGSAIRHLAIQLKTGAQASDVTLASVLIFLFAEIQHTLSSNWRYHCDAIYAIVDMLGGMPAVVLCEPIIRYLLCYFVLVDVMGGTTAPSIDPNRARRHIELINLLPAFYGHGLSTTIPCPPHLLSEIISINALRSQKDALIPLGYDHKAAASDILKRVACFSAEKWAEDIGLHERSPSDSAKAQQQIESWDWQTVARAYQSAVTLYCMSSLLDTGDTPTGQQASNVDIALLKSTYRDLLLRSLKAIASNPECQLRKLVFWPLVIGGIEVDPDDSSSKDFILGELAWMSKTLGTASPLVAKDLLGKIWSSPHDSKGHSVRNWDSLFDRPYVFVI
ncbi:fungal-specific transcription factor domain-containing protein [Dactylonectria estremocensis]|uniref:Fungal-specific transcription factor domain-containing protein n=1 Tax=Dactylonectria estremocensis TaxID=1079267 RepID=A0A9P9E2P4_9HYPO|nr:fungal-specific transcription factor domain-containing protein [Dactylonectria estremocensis]